MASKVDSSVLSVISEDKTSVRKYNDSIDDRESVYNPKSRSAYGGGHKKKMHPLLLGPGRRDHGKYISVHAASKTNLSEFTQRIMSAKLLRVKQVQNQLTETQIQLNELINENRILRNLQKRQEGALRKYEGNHAELPQLIRSHNEEIRTLKANNKILKAQLKETNCRLKERETELEGIKENYNKLKRLSSEKNLLDRDKLQKKVEELQDIIKEQDEKIQVLSRKVLLESKNYRHHLNIEINKHRETQKDLNNALAMINRLEGQLLAREKINLLPGVGKMPLKRDTKSMMPTILNKALEIQSNVGTLDNSYREDAETKRRLSNADSADTDSELLNGLISSDDTPSPTPDIFPDINLSKKTSPEIKTSTEISTTKQEMFQLDCDLPGKHCGGLQIRKTPLPRRNSRLSVDIETNAKMITEKLSADIESIDNIVQEKGLNISSPLNRSRLNSLYEEVKTSASKIESEINNQLVKSQTEAEKISQEMEEVTKIKITDVRRNVPKRKLNEEKQFSKQSENTESSETDLKDSKDLTEPQQQKLITMSKTWNDIKDKIQEERIKAEQKMKELCSSPSDEEVEDDSGESQPEVEEPPTEKIDTMLRRETESKRFSINQGNITEEKKDLRFTNFTSDEYILTELEKTDKMFKKLKNENRKPLQKSSSLGKRSKTPLPLTKSNSLDPKQLDNISYRCESRRDPKFLDQFQNEQQKQNLLKALKAIDVGKDPNLSSEESDHSDHGNGKPFSDFGLKHIQRISSSTDRSKNDLMKELFGGNQRRLDRNDNIKMEYGTLEGISAGDD